MPLLNKIDNLFKPRRRLYSDFYDKFSNSTWGLCERLDIIQLYDMIHWGKISQLS